jgi:hypothetical protein
MTHQRDNRNVCSKKIYQHVDMLTRLLIAGGLAILIAGCGSAGNLATSTGTNPAPTFSGRIHGGQQPVSAAVIQLYAVSNSGYASASTPLLQNAVTSGSDGSFKISNDYTCPANTEVYVVATGGNPGLTPNVSNNALAMMAGLGACNTLTPSTFININELTTVASVWSLAPFMSGYASVGSTSTNSMGLVNAFAAIQQVVDISQGTIPGPALPSAATLPAPEINTLADIIAACINTSGGSAGDGTPCGKLFSAATVGSIAPTDTIGAALNIARHPAASTSDLFALSGAAGPYQPTLNTAPQNFLIGINYVGGGLSAPSGLALDSSGNVWLSNNGNSSITELSNAGLALSPSGGFTGGGLDQPSALALDANGNVWVANKTGNDVSIFSGTGTPSAASPLTGGGLNAPVSIAIDANGTAWIANSSGSSISAFSSAGAALSPSGFAGAGIRRPTAIAVNPN